MARRVNVSDLLGAPPTSAEQGPQGAVDNSTGDRLIHVKTARLLPNPHNPRDGVGSLSDLSSIVEIQRQSLLVVTRAAYLELYPAETEELRGCDFVVVNGCRRHAAAQLFGREQLACAVNDSIARSRASLLRAALDENVERKDLNPIEEAKAVMAIVAEYDTAKAAAEAEGWTPAWISQRKSLLKLHPDLQAMVRAHAAGDEERGLSIRRARRLGAVKGIEELTAEEQLAQLAALEAGDAAKKDTERQAQQAAADAASAASAASTRSAQAEADGFTAVNPGHPATPLTQTSTGTGAPAAEAGLTAAEEFTAVNSAGVSGLPDQRISESSSSQHSTTQVLVDLAVLDIEELAQVIFSTLSLDDAYRLADVLASKVLQATDDK